MDDTDAQDRSWSLPWPVKLILTAFIGGGLSCWTFWRFSSAYNDPLRSAFGLHILTVVFWTDVVATSLFLVEKNGWRTAAAKGSLLALVASLAIVVVLAVLLLIGALMVSNFVH